MTLAEVNLFKQDPIALFNVEEAMRRWETALPSLISHHGRRCCALAREWVFSTDHAQLNDESALTGPRWLRQRFTWGPSPWPISWCQVVDRKVLDCGAFGALAHEIFSKRGIRSFRTQVIQEFSEQATEQWISKWTAEEAPVDWITAGLIYHEVCAIETAPHTIKLWDPSAGWWSDPRRVHGYGAIRALRVFTESPYADDNFTFDCRRVLTNHWQELKVFRPASRTGSDSRLPVASPIDNETIQIVGDLA